MVPRVPQTDFVGRRIQVNTDGCGTANNETSQAAGVMGGALYIGTAHSTDGAEMWERDGTAWRQITSGGFGDVNNVAIAANGLTEHGGFLIAGTFSPGGGEAWEIDPRRTGARHRPSRR